MGVYIKGKLPTEFNGITMKEAVYWADIYLQDNPCDRMWDAIRALRDFCECVNDEAIEVTEPHGRLIDADKWLKEIECGASFYEFLKAEIPNAPSIDIVGCREHKHAKTEQTDIHGLTDCDFCKGKNCEDCEGGKDEPQTDWHYDEQDATWYPYKHENEPQAE